MKSAEYVMLEGRRVSSSGGDVDGLLGLMLASSFGAFGANVLPEIRDGINGMNTLRIERHLRNKGLLAVASDFAGRFWVEELQK